MSTQYLPPTRIYQRPGVDSTRWQVFVPRDDDIVISTAPKSGTTWAQAIVRELIVHAMRQAGVTDPSQFPAPDNGSSPFVESIHRSGSLDQLQANLEAQPHRRFLKSHLALDGLPIYPQVKYLIIGRDQRDVFMSLWNFYASFTDEFYNSNNNPRYHGEPFPRCPADIHDFWIMWTSRSYADWEQQQGFPFAGSMHHAQSWWDYRQLDNILLLHYADLKADPPGEIRCIADFLEIEISDEALAKVVEHTSLGAMRQRASATDHMRILRNGARNFFYKGTNGRWQGVLTEAELETYEQVKARILSPDCARWLELGRAALSIYP